MPDKTSLKYITKCNEKSPSKSPAVPLVTSPPKGGGGGGGGESSEQSHTLTELMEKPSGILPPIETPDDDTMDDVVDQDPNLYRIFFYMKHFRENDIIVKTVDQTVVIDASHKEHIDEHGFVTRSMVRKQRLPDDVLAESLVSYFSGDGVLIIQGERSIKV